MVIMQDRSKLDEAIDQNGDPRWIVLLLSGAKGSTAGQIHGFIDSAGLEPWRKYFLITDIGVLDESERNAWFAGAHTERYAVLKRKTKKVAWTGPVSELLRVDGKPSILKIRKAFTKGRGDN
jgi:hypothetical protein